MRVPFADVAKLNAEVWSEIDAAIAAVIRSNSLVLGPNVAAFEHEFADYCQVGHCVGVGCGLDALTLMLRAHGIGQGDEVIVASNTFIATWLAVSAVGARPIPVEPDESTMNLDPRLIDSAVTHRTRAILVTHLYGRKAEMSALRRLADYYRLSLLVDAAQAHGIKATDDGLGDSAAFSFYPTKNLGALGDGGAVVTSNHAVANQVRLLRNYGAEEKDRHLVAGVNSRLDELQAAVLRAKLRRLDEWNARRAGNAAIYDSALEESRGETVHQIYVARTGDRERLRQWLDDRGIGTMIHYPTPPHRQLAYAKRWADGFAPSLPIADRLSRRVLSLPIGPEHSASAIEFVANAVREFARQSDALEVA